jgi:hypothetical protein
MSNTAEKFTAYQRMEPSSERLKAEEEKATALLCQAIEPRPETPELEQLAEHLGTERQQLVAQLRVLRGEFSQRRTRSSALRQAATKGTKI